MPTIKMPKPITRPTSENYWIRKKVPADLRPMVGKTEIWATLGTKDERQANIRIGAVNAAIEAEWTRLRSEAARAARSAEAFVPEPFRLTHQDLHALRREEHMRVREASRSRRDCPISSTPKRIRSSSPATPATRRKEFPPSQPSDGRIFAAIEPIKLMQTHFSRRSFRPLSAKPPNTGHLANGCSAPTAAVP